MRKRGSPISTAWDYGFRARGLKPAPRNEGGWFTRVELPNYSRAGLPWRAGRGAPITCVHGFTTPPPSSDRAQPWPSCGARLRHRLYARLRHRLPGVALRPHVVERGLEVRQLLLGHGQLLPQLGVGPRLRGPAPGEERSRASLRRRRHDGVDLVAAI